MRGTIAKLLFICVLPATSAICQSKQGQQVKNAVEESKEFPDLKCRADTQRWTADPFDYSDPKNLSGSRAIMVNGQLRLIPITTAHVTIRGLLERAREMDVCTREDADFEKQFATYSAMAEAYNEEHCFRYMYFLTKHHLDEQFVKEDAEENK